MISLSQIQLLEEKVESAVAKIMQLNQEKEALAKRCLQLEEENKLLQENLLNFEQDQKRIEQGIIKALDRLNVVENSVLQAVAIQHQEQPTDEVQVPPTDFIHQEVHLSVATQEVLSQTEIENDSQHSLQPSENDLGLAPMFSEEVVSPNLVHPELDEQVSQEHNPFLEQNQDIGLLTNNQDNYAVVPASSQEEWNSRGHLFLVADGMGGNAAGELASKLAADHVPMLYKKRILIQIYTVTDGILTI